MGTSALRLSFKKHQMNLLVDLETKEKRFDSGPKSRSLRIMLECRTMETGTPFCNIFSCVSESMYVCVCSGSAGSCYSAR